MDAAKRPTKLKSSTALYTPLYLLIYDEHYIHNDEVTLFRCTVGQLVQFRRERNKTKAEYDYR